MGWKNLRTNWRNFKSYRMLDQRETWYAGGGGERITTYDRGTTARHRLDASWTRILLGLHVFEVMGAVIIFPVTLILMAVVLLGGRSLLFKIGCVAVVLVGAYIGGLWYNLKQLMIEQARRERSDLSLGVGVVYEPPSYLSLLFARSHD